MYDVLCDLSFSINVLLLIDRNVGIGAIVPGYSLVFIPSHQAVLDEPVYPKDNLFQPSGVSPLICLLILQTAPSTPKAHGINTCESQTNIEFGVFLYAGRTPKRWRLNSL